MLESDRMQSAIQAASSSQGHDVLSQHELPGDLHDDLVPAPSIQERAAGLAGHVDKLASERASLDKWNLNAQGRNQGLVHVVDYARARPPTAVKGGPLNGENLEDTIGRGPLPGGVISEMLQERGMEAGDFGKFAAKNLQPMLAQEGDGPRLTRTHDDDTPEDIDALRNIDAAIGHAKQAKSEAIQQVPGNQRRAWLQGEGKPLVDRVNHLEQLALDRTLYSVPREDSKAGRVQTVARAMGEADDAFDGDEINQVTNALDVMTGADDTTATHREADGSQTVDLGEQWARNGESGHGGAHWEMQPTAIQDVSASSSYVSGGDGQKIKAHTWGPNADQEKYSTVMGA